MTIRRRIHPEDYGYDGDELSSGTIAFDDDGRVLIVRCNGARRASFPKGHVEYGETLEECAIRETLEETGMHVRIASDRTYDTRYRTQSGNMKDVCLFEARAVSGTPRDQEGETSEVGFVPVEEAMRRLPRTQAGILRRCLRNRAADGR